MFIVDNLIMIKGNGFTVLINELDEVSFLIINPSLSFSTSPWGATSSAEPAPPQTAYVALGVPFFSIN